MIYKMNKMKLHRKTEPMPSLTKDRNIKSMHFRQNSRSHLLTPTSKSPKKVMI